MWITKQVSCMISLCHFVFLVQQLDRILQIRPSAFHPPSPLGPARKMAIASELNPASNHFWAVRVVVFCNCLTFCVQTQRPLYLGVTQLNETPNVWASWWMEPWMQNYMERSCNTCGPAMVFVSPHTLFCNTLSPIALMHSCKASSKEGRSSTTLHQWHEDMLRGLEKSA